MKHARVDMIHAIREGGDMATGDMATTQSAASEDSGGDENPIDLNERRAAVTRDAIREAVNALMIDEHPSAISVPAVAARAGVSVRTIYRYFPNKQALLDDVANLNFARIEKLSRQSGGNDEGGLFADPATWLPVMWERFGEDVPAVKAQHSSPAGFDLRDRRLAASRAGVAAAVGQRIPGLDAEDVAVFADAIVAVTSSAMFLELHDRMGWSPREAAEISLWIVDAMQQRLVSGDVPLSSTPLSPAPRPVSPTTERGTPS